MRTIDEVREGVKSCVADMIADLDCDTDRETLIERMDEECDQLFGQLVQHGRIDQYDSKDLVRTAQPCAIILKVADEDAWIEDDYGLWDGLQYGMLASMAFFSLRNLIYQHAVDAHGVDSNEDWPLANLEAETA